VFISLNLHTRILCSIQRSKIVPICVSLSNLCLPFFTFLALPSLPQIYTSEPLQTFLPCRRSASGADTSTCGYTTRCSKRRSYVTQCVLLRIAVLCYALLSHGVALCCTEFRRLSRTVPHATTDTKEESESLWSMVPSPNHSYHTQRHTMLCSTMNYTVLRHLYAVPII
jgi:hypothetical protein